MADERPPISFDPPVVDSGVRVPLKPDASMDERGVIERTRRYFGYPVVAVELTEDHYQDAMEEAKQWFIDNWGMIRNRYFDLFPGVREIQLTEDVREVQECYFEGVRLPPMVFDKDFPFFTPFPMGASGGMAFSYPTGLYSGLVQQLQWIEQLKRIFSAEPDWEFDSNTRVLRVFPAFETGEKRMLVEYTSNSLQISELFGEALITFMRYFRALCKMRLGEIRSKYDSVPVAGGSASLNGTALKDEGKEEVEKLTEWSHQRTAPYRFLVG